MMRGWQRCLISIAVLIGSQVVTAASPDNLSSIMPDNASQVERLAQIGGDHVLDLEWSPDARLSITAHINGALIVWGIQS